MIDLRLYTIFFLLFISLTEVASQDNFRVVFYNVENLFDARDDSLKDDKDFLPDGFMRWNEWKYREKLKNIHRH